MDTRKQELKRLKKECRRAKGRNVTLWKSFGIFFLVMTLLFTPLCLAVKAFDNTIASYLGGTFWKLENRDENAQYFKPDELDFRELSHRVASEGITLLKNENNALPLAAGASIRLYGADQLKAALEAEGFTVNDSGDTAIALWDKNAETLQTLGALKASGAIKKLILLLVDADAAALNSDICQADALLWMGQQGAEAAVAALLSGKVSPSGRLPNTFSYESAPLEGIYAGYKYYETRYEDFVMNAGNTGDFAYGKKVAYPFGYGLSYTGFTYSNMETAYNETTDQFALTLTVTNTGSVPGKETVQVYAQSPYTDYDREKGVEKPAVQLVGFGKTQELAPGAAETVTVYVDKVNFASYDAGGAKTYILEAGKYYLTAAADAHKAVNNILAAKGFTPETTENRMDAVGEAALVYSWEQAELDTKTYATKTDKPVIGTLSRRDWMGTWNGQTWETPQESRYNPGDYPVTGMPTLGAENGLRLQDMIGLSVDDPKWQTLLDQLTFGDIVKLLADNYYMQMPLKSVQAPGAFHRSVAEMGLPAAHLLAATWNTQLTEDVASGLGNRCLEENVAILRGEVDSAYSEDAFLAEKTVAAQTAGLEKKGVLTVIYRQDESFVQDAIIAGENIAGQWLPVAVWELYQWENDPVIVSAMRQACHRNLYALANSCAMNGIGENTTVSLCEPGFVLGVWIATPVLFAAFVFFAVMWRRGRKKWKKTEAYLDYRTMKNTLKEEKKQ